MGGCTGHPGVLDGSDVNPAGTEQVSRLTVSTDETARIQSIWQWGGLIAGVGVFWFFCLLINVHISHVEMYFLPHFSTPGYRQSFYPGSTPDVSMFWNGCAAFCALCG